MRPGVLEVLARFLRSKRAFISDDFPTLDRPMKQTSDSLSGGKPPIPATPLEKDMSFNKGDFLIPFSFIVFFGSTFLLKGV